jgi:hypothetical protein
LAFALPGCRSAADAPQGLSRDRFVTAYVALVQARIESEGDSAVYRAARDRALDRLGVTPAELRAFVERGKTEPEQLGDAWAAIAAKLDTLYGGVTTEPPPAMQREPGAETESGEESEGPELEGETPDVRPQASAGTVPDAQPATDSTTRKRAAPLIIRS